MSKKISELPVASSLTGAELVEIVQSSTSKRTTIQNISGLYSATPSTSGATITLDFNTLIQLIAVGSASFSGSKTIALSNNTNARVFNFHIQLSGNASLTMPSTFTMDSDESRWNSGTKVLTLTGAGYYELSGTFDNTNWRVKASSDGGYV